jgi:hypothetical protein
MDLEAERTNAARRIHEERGIARALPELSGL